MSSTETSTQPAKKRARRSMASTRAASASDILRAKKISNILSELLEEFPEMKFMLDFENLEVITETAVVKYEEEKEAKKHENQFLLNYCQDPAPLHSLPDEVLSNCLSFVGKGHYGVVGLVSKKLNEVYKEDFGKETAYLEMATSVNLASHCLNDFCKDMEQKDEILKAAAVNGNIDILRAAVKDDFDLFPLVAMKKITVYKDGEDEYYEIFDLDEDYYEDELEEMAHTIYCRNDCTNQYEDSEKPTVNLSKLVERNRLKVLKYLYEELNYRKGLQMYVKPAIEHGKLDILKWLDSIGFLDEEDQFNRIQKAHDDYGRRFKRFYFCDCAVKSGNVEVLKWLRDKEYLDFDSSSIMEYAICSGSLEMIKFCFEIGYDFNDMRYEYEITKRKSIELYRLLNELGFRFEGGIRRWVRDGNARSLYDIGNCFDIIKFLRSIAVPWDEYIMKDIVEYGTLEMIQFAHKDGCPWTTHGDEYFVFIESWSLEKFNYIKDNGCKFDFEYHFNSSPREFNHLVGLLRHKKELALLKFFVGENSNFDSKLAQKMQCSDILFEGTHDLLDSWLEGINYLLEHGKNVKTFKSVEEVFNNLSPRMDFLKYFHSQGLPWCLDPSRNTNLLSKIACYNNLEDVKWAYDNGCKGEVSMSYREEEWEGYGENWEMHGENWEEEGIRKRDEWKANCHFFVENDMLHEMKLVPESKNYHRLRSDLVAINNSRLKSLVDGGNISFNSEREKEDHLDEAIERCFEHSQGGHGENFNNRKRLALFQQMRVGFDGRINEDLLNGSNEGSLDDSESSVRFQ